MSSKIFGITLTRVGMFPSRQRWEKKKKRKVGGGGEERDPGEGWSSVAQLDNVFLRLFTNESDQAG